MNKQIYILVIEDENAVLEAILRDIEHFENEFPIETANSAEEAMEIIDEIRGNGDVIGLVLCDHLLPGMNGVKFMSVLNTNDMLKHTKKVLITGQAGHDDTINAINNASLDYYIGKPWDTANLVKVVKNQLTEFVIDENLYPVSALYLLNMEIITEAVRNGKLITDM